MRIPDRGDRPSYILGVNGGPHDGSAALLRDGTLVAMLEQERLNRQRYAFRCSPSGAIAACLAEEGIGLDAVSEIAVGWDVPVLMDVDGRTFDERQFIDWMLGPLTASARQLPRVRYVDHHLAHAASAFSAWPVREGMRARLPAAVHVDGSARPQIVRQGQPRYHGVISAFHERTGVPAVINTSFNLAGEPIVHSADDAISTFLRSELDVLVLDNVVAVKRNRDGKRPSPPRHQVEDQHVSPWT